MKIHLPKRGLGVRACGPHLPVPRGKPTCIFHLEAIFKIVHLTLLNLNPVDCKAERRKEM